MNEPDLGVIPERLIVSYLSLVDVAMPRVPEDRRSGLISEMREHIDRLVEDLKAAGIPPEEAVRKALSTMGSPESIGRKYARMWNRRADRGSVITAFLVSTVFGAVGSSFLTPTILGRDDLVGNRWNFETSVATTLLLSIPQIVGGLMAGFMAPRGAIKGVGIRVIVTVTATLVMLGFPPHETASIVNLQLENAFAGLLCFLSAVLGRQAALRVGERAELVEGRA